MRKFSICILGITACAAGSLCADGFSESDRALIAGKGVFPDDTSSGEASLPEADMTYDSDDSNDDTNNGTNTSGTGTEKDVNPQVKSNQPNSGKDVMPQSQSPNTGKDVMPQSQGPSAKAN